MKSNQEPSVAVTTQHTPGPWKMSPRAHEFRSNNPGLISGNNGLNLVATVYLEANARLIAAAPQLLEALEAALGPLDDYAATFLALKPEGPLAVALNKARAAIAAATAR